MVFYGTSVKLIKNIILPFLPLGFQISNKQAAFRCFYYPFFMATHCDA